MLDDTTPLGRWLRSRRILLDQHQEEAAAILGVSNDRLSRWERGEPVVKVADVRSIAKWSGVDEVEVYHRIARELEGTAAA